MGNFKRFFWIKHDYFGQRLLEQKVRAFKPDLIYERACYLNLSGCRIAQKYKIKHFMEINAPYIKERVDLSGKSLLLKIAKYIEKRQLLMTNKVFVVSSALKAYYSEILPSIQYKFIVTPNAINEEHVKMNFPKDPSLKKKYNIHGNFIIGFVGSFFYWHGIDILIKAFKEAIGSCQGMKLVLIGDGEIKDELIRMTKELDIEKKVIFTGYIGHNQIFHHIDFMDVCVMGKSNWYGSPVKIFEYGAMKKSIIAPDVVPVRDVMEHEKDAILVNTQDDITMAIKTLYQNKQLRERLAINFHRKVFSQYTWNKVACTILEQYNN